MLILGTERSRHLRRFYRCRPRSRSLPPRPPGPRPSRPRPPPRSRYRSRPPPRSRSRPPRS
ncbi:MAG: hypothetical protein E6K57_09075 [Nitrospirae bacterium]|nr:MAG: hypothetical protein E6K57_09075 [Nitrospirota bacterium]